MTQQNSTTNWVIQGSNGQPQVIKVVQQGGKAISGIMTSPIAGQQVKIFKSPTSQEAVQVYGTGSTAQIYRTITATQKLITKGSPLQVSKGTKTIRLTPSQMQNIKLVTAQSSPKVQISQTNAAIPVVQAHTIQQTQQAKNISPPILQRKRTGNSDLEYVLDAKRSRKSEKVGKGLRHFSMKVCEKVRKKGNTTYNEVADELVEEFTSASSNNSLADQQYDQKNIRRRVYDALNVLMAMKIISKEKKEIRWIGLPTNSLQECVQLEREKRKKIHLIQEKKKQLQDLLLNQIAFKNLAQRNKEMEEINGPPAPNSYIQLPFLIVSTNKKTEIDCNISNDKKEYLFKFNDKFEIKDDVKVLKSLGMLMGLDDGSCTPDDLEKMKGMVPKSLESYIMQLALGLPDEVDRALENEAPGTSTMLTSEDLVEATLDEENSHQSSSDRLSPCAPDFSDEEGLSDLSSDIE